MKYVPYEKEVAIAKAGLTVSIVLLMLFIGFATTRVTSLQHKQIKNDLNKLKKDVEYVKGHQEYNTKMLQELKFVEEVGESVSLDLND